MSRAQSERMKRRWAEMSPAERKRRAAELAERGRKVYRQRFPARYAKPQSSVQSDIHSATNKPLGATDQHFAQQEDK